jgi:hypothetical protein
MVSWSDEGKIIVGIFQKLSLPSTRPFVEVDGRTGRVEVQSEHRFLQAEFWGGHWKS